jgi:hypothetical protein
MSFFGFLGNVLKGGISIATHGLINLGGAGSTSGGVPSSAALPASFQPRGFAPSAGRMPVISFPGGSGLAAGSPAPGGGSALIPHLACGPGMHHKKSKGAFGGMLASACVRNRHMNVANPKALRRSIRRLYGAEKMYARLLRVTHPHKIKGGRVHPKPPRRRRS